MAISEGKVIAASMAGKVKTFTQMVAIVLTMIVGALGISGEKILGLTVPVWLMGIVAAIPLYSGLTYLLDNRKLLKVK